MLGPLGGSGVVDTMKLVVLGGTVETARRVSSSAWTSFVNCSSSTPPDRHPIRTDRSPPAAFFLTAHFSEEDYPFDWLMLWLSKRPEWQRSVSMAMSLSVNSHVSAADRANLKQRPARTPSGSLVTHPFLERSLTPMTLVCHHLSYCDNDLYPTSSP